MAQAETVMQEYRKRSTKLVDALNDVHDVKWRELRTWLGTPANYVPINLTRSSG